jgi:hypothetical protein
MDLVDDGRRLGAMLGQRRVSCSVADSISACRIEISVGAKRREKPMTKEEIKSKKESGLAGRLLSFRPGVLSIKTKENCALVLMVSQLKNQNEKS